MALMVNLARNDRAYSAGVHILADFDSGYVKKSALLSR